MSIIEATAAPTQDSALPFVNVRPSGAVDLWAVNSTNDWTTDCATGNVYADEMVGYLRATGDHAFLGQTVRAMPAQPTGIETGFFTRLSEFLTA